MKLTLDVNTMEVTALTHDELKNIEGGLPWLLILCAALALGLKGD